MGFSYQSVTAPKTVEHYELQEMGGGFNDFGSDYSGGGLAEPPGAGGLSEPEGSEPIVALGANELGSETPSAETVDRRRSRYGRASSPRQ